jgi:outer membrane cobalamin receptor
LSQFLALALPAAGLFAAEATSSSPAASAGPEVHELNTVEVVTLRDALALAPAASLDGDTVKSLTPVNNNALLRLLPGVSGGLANKDRFGGPVSIRGGMTWGIVETVDGYPTVDVVPVAAEDGGYTANLSTIIPSIALTSLSVATEGLGVNYGQATGGVIRSQVKRGNPANPFSAVQAEYNTIGEVVAMAETSGGQGKLDAYAAVQTVQGDYDDEYATTSRPLEQSKLYSALVKLGYTVAPGRRFELFTVAGTEDHKYYQLPVAGRVDYTTEKDNLFVGARYDHNIGAVRWEVGATFNDFHENRINENTGLSARNRPQEALKVFANAYHDHDFGPAWHWSASHGVEFTDDHFRDITTTEKRFDFAEQAVFTRHRLSWNKTLTFTAGLRAAELDNGFRDDDQLAHNVGVSYEIDQVGTFHASHATGYRLNKAFYLFWGGGTNILRAPATGIDPSESETWEVGYTRPFAFAGGTGRLRATYFETNESRIFNLANTGTGTPYYDEGLAQGVEVWLDWNPTERLMLFAGYGHVSNERDSSSNPAANNLGLRFSPLPEDTASIGLTWKPTDAWEATLAGLYDAGSVREFYDNGVRETEQFGDFIKVDAAIARRLTPSLVTYLRVENLLDERDLGYTAVREESDGTTTANNATQRDPGILFSFGARWEF